MKVKLQDQVLSKLSKDKIETVLVVNGMQIKGIVKDFDNYTVWLKTGKNNQLIYKHAIMAIVPQEEIELEY